MKFRAYALNRLDNGDILEWNDGQYRYWAVSHDDQRDLVKARVAKGEVVDVHRPRRLGRRQLNAAIHDDWIKPYAADADEVPAPVALIAREGPDVVEGVTAD